MGSSTIKAKYNVPLIIASVWVLILGAGAIYVSVSFLVPLATLMTVVVIYAMSMKCPHCGASILCREDLALWCSLRVPATCRRCNTDIK